MKRLTPFLHSAKWIRLAIESITLEGRDDVELIIVDGGSDDATVPLATELGARVLAGKFSRGTARAEGAKAARGQYLLFLDSDQSGTKGLIRACLAAISGYQWSAAWIPEVDIGQGVWYRCLELDRKLAFRAGLVYPRFFRRSEYLDFGGHSGSVQDYMEDRELFLRWSAAGGRIRRAETLLLNDHGHVNPISLGQKGARASRDARDFYGSVYGGRESLAAVILPRLASAVSSTELSSARITTLCALPLYLVAARGPRMARASLGYLDAKLRPRSTHRLSG